MIKNEVTLDAQCPCDGCMFFYVCFEPNFLQEGSTLFVPNELNFCSKSIIEILPSQPLGDNINPLKFFNL